MTTHTPATLLDPEDFPSLTCGLIDAEVKRRANAYPRLVGALRNIRDELGVPQPGYPQPVANAALIARDLLAELGE